jgi:hypothetical protein
VVHRVEKRRPFADHVLPLRVVGDAEEEIDVRPLVRSADGC